MASASSSPLNLPDPFDLGVHTPDNLARGARAALLRNTPAIVPRPIGTPPALTRVTPSSPLKAVSRAAALEGTQRVLTLALSETPHTEPRQPVSIAESAARLLQDHAETFDAKRRVFRAFSEAFDSTAQQFLSGTDYTLAQQLAHTFLDFWSRSLKDSPSEQKPTYSEVLANSPRSSHQGSQQNKQSDSRRQGQPLRSAPPKAAPAPEDLRVFIRLESDAPARKHISYAIRTHIASKTGIELHRLPQASAVNSGWAIRAADIPTRDLLVQRKADWAEDLGATAVEISQKWFTYVVEECPRRLTDIQGHEVHYLTALQDEVKCQTGLTPVNMRMTLGDTGELPTKTLVISFLEPTKRPWRLFGASRLARVLKKSNSPRPCSTCWDYHAQRVCARSSVCKRCGEPGHALEGCTAPERCVNCFGPHAADFTKCPARPKRSHGVLHRLTKGQKEIVRQFGSQLHQQQMQSQHHVIEDTELEGSEALRHREQWRLSNTPASSARAASCIVVLTGSEDEGDSTPRTVSPAKRRRRNNPAPSSP